MSLTRGPGMRCYFIVSFDRYAYADLDITRYERTCHISNTISVARVKMRFCTYAIKSWNRDRRPVWRASYQQHAHTAGVSSSPARGPVRWLTRGCRDLQGLQLYPPITYTIPQRSDLRYVLFFRCYMQSNFSRLQGLMNSFRAMSRIQCGHCGMTFSSGI